MVAVDLLVPYVFVLLSPDAFPMFRQIAAEYVLPALFRIRPDMRSPCPRSSRSVTVKLMVPYDKQFFDLSSVLKASPLRKEHVEYVTMVLSLHILPAMSHIAKMRESIDIAFPEKLHRIRNVCERETAMRCFPVPTGLKMRVAQYSKHEIRLFPMLPSFRSRKDRQAVQRKQCRRSAGKEGSP